MQKKNFLIASTCFLLLPLALSLTLIEKNSASILKTKATDFTLTLDSSNAYKANEETKEIKTSLGNSITFHYADALEATEAHVILNEGGYLANVDQITGGNQVKVNFTGGKLLYSFGNDKTHMRSLYLASGEALANPSYGDYRYVSFKAEDGQVTIASLEINYSCVDSGVSYKAVDLSLSGPGSGEVKQGEEFILPTLKATSYDGFDLTDEVSVVDSLGETVNASDLTFKSDVIGAHVLTYSVTDFDVTVTKTVTINVTRRLFNDGGSNDISVSNEASAPVVTSSDTGQATKTFYMKDGASTNYYMEWTLNHAGTDGVGKNDQIIAAAHYGNENGDPSGYVHSFGYKLKTSGAFEFSHGREINVWNLGWVYWTGSNYFNGLKDSNGNKISDLNPITKDDVKMALARDNEALYYYINDVLVCAEYSSIIKDKPTYPGLLIFGNDASAPKNTLSNFGFVLNGEEAKEKVNQLNESIFMPGNYNDGYLTANNLATIAKDGFVYNEGMTSENNLNNAAVFLKTSIHGKFSFNFDIECSKRGDNDGWGKIVFDLRTIHDKANLFKIDMTSGGDNSVYELFTYSEKSGATNGGTNYASDYNTALENPNVKTKIHINWSLNEIDTTNKLEKYVITFTNTLNNKSFELNYDLNYSSNDTGLNSPKYLVILGQKWSGSISNFTITNN